MKSTIYLETQLGQLELEVTYNYFKGEKSSSECAGEPSDFDVLKTELEGFEVPTSMFDWELIEKVLRAEGEI